MRAILLYQQSLKCKNCNPNVGMVLLCSCADALQLVGDQRSKENFKALYMKYCPSKYRKPPITYLSKEKPLKLKDSPSKDRTQEITYLSAEKPFERVPFEEAILHIYQKFRCPYIHEGVENLEILPKNVYAHPCIDKFKKKNDLLLVDLIKLRRWFEEITFESLYQMLIEPRI